MTILVGERKVRFSTRKGALLHKEKRVRFSARKYERTFCRHFHRVDFVEDQQFGGMPPHVPGGAGGYDLETAAGEHAMRNGAALCAGAGNLHRRTQAARGECRLDIRDDEVSGVALRW